MINYLKKISPNSKIINSNVLNVDLPSKHYDLIVAMAFIHCFTTKDLRIILKKVKNWLKDDGYFAVCTTIHSHSQEGYFEKEDYNNVIRYRKKWKKEQLEKFLFSNGFYIVQEFSQDEITKQKSWVSYLLKINNIKEGK